MKGVIFHVPVDVAATPANGEALCDRWWAVHPDKGVAFYFMPFGYFASEEPSPQCNSSEAMTRHLKKRLYPDHDVRHLPVVFMGHADREMRRLRKQMQAERDVGRAALKMKPHPGDAVA